MDKEKQSSKTQSPRTFKVGEEITVVCFGITTTMVAVGHGAYPYDCPAKDKRPDDMIFRGKDGSGWCTAHELKNSGKGYFIL